MDGGFQGGRVVDGVVTLVFHCAAEFDTAIDNPAKIDSIGW
jgi:hypothetical protein